jgi:hypothetical protein
MDPHRFDTLTKTLARPGTRRRLFTVLASLPLVGAMTEDLADEATAARRPLDWLFARAARAQQRRQTRRQRRRRELRQERRRERQDSRNGNGNGKGNNKGKGNSKGKGNNDKRCHAKPDATTCDGQCGAVPNNCNQVIDCGPCACVPACDVCSTCDTTVGNCIADPEQAGDPCDPCKVCDATGVCVADAAQLDQPCGTEACHVCSAAGTCESIGTGCGAGTALICCEAGFTCCGETTGAPDCCDDATEECSTDHTCVAAGT